MQFLSDSRNILTHDTDSSHRYTPANFIFKILLCLLFLLSFSFLSGCSFYGEHTETVSTETETETAYIDPEETARLLEYLNTVFQNEVSASTLSMHYSITQPENYGIEVTRLHSVKFQKRFPGSPCLPPKI